MAPLDPRDPQAWTELLSQWQQAQRACAQWWTTALAPLAGAPATTDGDAPAAAGILRQVQARFQPRFEALAAALLALPGTGGTLPEIASPAPGDRRFVSPAWRQQPYFALLRQGYLLYAEFLREVAAAAPLPPADRQRLEFATRQYLDAIAPSNFLATNPDALAQAIATEGASVVQGLRNLAEDARKGRITMTDENAFSVGGNLAVTPGAVVYRNELIELIQYAATTPTVHRRPLVIVPPCINKYYILDLRPDNSFVRHAVAQGHTVFMVSWRNVPTQLGGVGWDDYIEQGALTALRVAREISGSRTVNALGFCVGGTILASALAVMSARGDTGVESATLLTTMLDFSEPGEISVYVSREFLASREPQLLAGERARGAELASAFASLRANDLVWNYVVGNYLKGETPPAFDLLFWNGDSTNLPGPMYVYYLRNMYLDNRLREPGALTMAGVPVDLSRVTVPTYIYASREDHIVPWRAGYRSTGLLGGDVTFVLGASGHIAGVVNPPQPPRRHHWVNDLLTEDPDDWLARAQTQSGSWWPHWSRWLAAHGGARQAAPSEAGSRKHPPLAPAPGAYVLDPA